VIKVDISLDRIDYGEIADTFIPVIIDKLSAKENAGRLIQILKGLDDLPGALAKTVLNSLPENAKEELVVYFLEKYKDKIIEAVNEFARVNQVKVKIGEIKVSREPKAL